MDEETIKNKLNQIFKNILGVESSNLDISMDNTEQWDSLKHLQLLSEIEEVFGIKTDFEDCLKMINMKNIYEVLKENLNKEVEKRKKIVVNEERLLPHQRMEVETPFLIEYNNIYELFKAKLNLTPDKDFLIFPDREKKFTYQEFFEEFLKLSVHLKKQRIDKGDRINLILPNSPEFILIYFAALSLGITVVPINPDLSPSEMAYVVRDCQAKVVFYDLSLGMKVEKFKDDFSGVSFLIVQHLLEKISPLELDKERLIPKVELYDEAVIIYTSGTTGNPKGAVLTHLNLLSDAKVISENFRFTSETRTLCILPLFHNNGQVMTLLTPLYQGGSTVIVQGKASLMSFWGLVDKYKINWTSVMPSILSILLSMPFERKDNTMQGIACGGQVLTEETQRKFEERFGVPIFEGYGLTETTSFACFNQFPAEKRKMGTVGIPFTINKIEIFDENDQKLSSGQEGEICIKGLNVVNEYFGLEEKNKIVFRNGWFHSGDFGYKDEEGNIYFKTRKDFLIIKGGENIYPSEIENVLFKHPAVAESAVIGIPSELLGEEICAFVKLNKGCSITEKELKEFLFGKIAGYKHPKSIIIIDQLTDLEDIPKGPTKKVLYRKLKDYYMNKIYKQKG